MDSRLMRFIDKGKRNGKRSGNHGAKDRPHPNARGDPVRSRTEGIQINQSLTASEENRYVATFPLVYLDLT